MTRMQNEKAEVTVLNIPILSSRFPLKTIVPLESIYMHMKRAYRIWASLKRHSTKFPMRFNSSTSGRRRKNLVESVTQSGSFRDSKGTDGCHKGCHFLYKESNADATISTTYFTKEPRWLLSLWRRRVSRTAWSISRKNRENVTLLQQPHWRIVFQRK